VTRTASGAGTTAAITLPKAERIALARLARRDIRLEALDQPASIDLNDGLYREI